MRRQLISHGSYAPALLLGLLCCGFECRANSEGTGRVSIFYLNGISVSSQVYLQQSSLWRIAAVGDLDNDGHPDLVFQDPVTGESQVWFMGGADGTTLTGAAILSGVTTWRVVGVGHFNGDPRLDVVWQDSMSGNSQVSYMDGTRALGVLNTAPLSVPNAWQIVAVADFNDDGQPDLVWQDVKGTGAVQIWIMNGTNFASAVQVSFSNSFRVVAAGNFGGAAARPTWYGRTWPSLARFRSGSCDMTTPATRPSSAPATSARPIPGRYWVRPTSTETASRTWCGRTWRAHRASRWTLAMRR